MSSKPFQVWVMGESSSELVSQHGSWQLAAKELARKLRVPFEYRTFAIRDTTTRTFHVHVGGVYVKAA